MALILVVPGRCEKLLLRRVLAREFPGVVERIVDADGDTNVIVDAARARRRLLSEGHTPVFLRDLDEFPCRSALRQAFDRSLPARDIVIVYRCIEAWYLADGEAINAQFTRLKKRFKAKRDADSWTRPQDEIKRLLEENGNRGGRQYEKTAFADSFSQHFSLLRAAANSKSARRFVDRLSRG